MHYSEIPKSSRKEWLHKNFLFNCDCKACQENWPTFDGLPAVSMREIQENHSKFTFDSRIFKISLRNIFTYHLALLFLQDNEDL